jgi:hypothetical protein
MGWRDKYKVHPAADVFPMGSDEELATLGEDIKKNGLKDTVAFYRDELIDGRNRFEAMERSGIERDGRMMQPGAIYSDGKTRDDPEFDVAAYVISKNIHRRHLTKEQRADLIVAARMAAKPRQNEEVSKGGRGKVDPSRRRPSMMLRSMALASLPSSGH